MSQRFPNHTIVVRAVMVPCANCLTTGSVPVKNGRVECPACRGKREVERYINVIEHIEDNTCATSL